MPSNSSIAPGHLHRRRLLALAASVPLLTAAACSSPGGTGGTALALTDPLPVTVPAGTKLVVGDPSTEQALRLSGELARFTFEVTFANLSGGPQTLEAFRAKALDVGAVADIPPLQAAWTGVGTKIIAAQYRQDPLRHPIYQLGIAPGVKVATLADLRGRSIAYSPGQAQGALVLRVLQSAHLAQTDVKLVELPSNGDVYATALAAHQVDVAPIGGVQVKRYLTKYGKDGATVLAHGLRDDPSHLYVREEALADAGKAAAIREYVTHWGAALRWIDDHPQEWIDGYYVANQGLSAADGRYLIDAAGRREVPADWSGHIKDHQATADLLSAEQRRAHIDVTTLWDRRFESVGAEAYQRGVQP